MSDTSQGPGWWIASDIRWYAPEQYPGYLPPPPPPQLVGAYPGGPTSGAYPVQQRTNGLAIASLIMGILGISVLAVIFGHIALSQIRQRGEAGRGLAIAGTVIGWVEIGLVALAFVLVVAVGGHGTSTS